MTQPLTTIDVINLINNPVVSTRKHKKPTKPRKKRPLVRYSALINGIPFKVREVEFLASTSYGLLWRIRRKLSSNLTYPPPIDATTCINDMVTSGDIVIFKTVRYLATETKLAVQINPSALSSNVPTLINRAANQVLSEEYRAEYIISQEIVDPSVVQKL